MKRLGGLLLLSMGIAAHVFAAVATPEIDPASGVAAVALLAGGIVVLRSRKR